MKELTPEQIDMLKRLQPKIKEALGDWKIGDRFIPDNSNFAIYDVMFVVDCGDVGICDAYGNMFLWSEKILRVPALEELWGMVDWTVWQIESNGYSETVIITHTEGFYFCDDITTAILKVLCEQWEV